MGAFARFNANTDAINDPVAYDTEPEFSLLDDTGLGEEDLAAGLPPPMEPAAPTLGMVAERGGGVSMLDRYQKYINAVKQMYSGLIEPEPEPQSKVGLLHNVLTFGMAGLFDAEQRARDTAAIRRRNAELNVSMLDTALRLGQAEQDAEMAERRLELDSMRVDFERQRLEDDRALNNAKLQLQRARLAAGLGRRGTGQLDASTLDRLREMFPGAKFTQKLPGGLSMSIPGEPDLEGEKRRWIAGRMSSDQFGILDPNELRRQADEIFGGGSSRPLTLDDVARGSTGGSGGLDSPEDVRAAFQSGQISRDEARALIAEMSDASEQEPGWGVTRTPSTAGTSGSTTTVPGINSRARSAPRSTSNDRRRESLSGMPR